MDAGAIAQQQQQLYGQAWAPRLRGLMERYAIPQSRLAAVVGLSAPMLSQLINAQRVKVSNPAVLARIVRLEELGGQRAGNSAALAAALDEVAGSTPTLSTVQRLVPQAVAGRDELLTALATYPAAELRAAAQAAVAVAGQGEASALGELLTAAAARAGLSARAGAADRSPLSRRAGPAPGPR